MTARRRPLRQVQVSGPGSVSIQAGGDIVTSGQPEKWWCDCDDMVGPHVHCVWGGKGSHLHRVEVPADHQERRRG